MHGCCPHCNLKVAHPIKLCEKRTCRNTASEVDPRPCLSHIRAEEAQHDQFVGICTLPWGFVGLRKQLRRDLRLPFEGIWPLKGAVFNDVHCWCITPPQS
eukprot:jgi/Botrbrau1/852/Bobra.0352s0045.1